MNKTLYKPFKYTGKGQFKYSVYVKNEKTGKPKKINFGHSDYEHYKDTTGVGAWSHKNHLDKERRKRYRARAGKIKDKLGRLTVKNKNSKNYWAYNKLW